MGLAVAKISLGVAYLWGEEFTIINSSDDIDEGWYFVMLNGCTFKDKKGVVRNRVSVVRKIDMDKEGDNVSTLLNIYYGTPTGIESVLGVYRHHIPVKMRNDSRFISFESLCKVFNYSMSISKDEEMRNFMHKVCIIVADSIIRTMVDKKETATKNEVQK